MKQADRGRLELQSHWLAFGALDVVLDELSIGESRRDEELLLSGEEFPIEEISELAAVDGEELGPGNDAQLLGDAAVDDTTDSNHVPRQMNAGRPEPMISPLYSRRSPLLLPS